MGTLTDLRGRRFERLLVTGRSGSDKNKGAIWECKCDCGLSKPVRAGDLLSGKTKSCGCLAIEARTKHGRNGTKLYNVWRGMLARCANPMTANYHGRGIKVCEAWLDFKTFLRDVGEIPFEGATLERKDNDGDYEPDNVVWASRKEQSANTRTNLWLEHNGERHILAQWAEITGLGTKTIGDRLRRGWSIDRALTTPAKRTREYRRTA
jgi:hypothetical protein